MGTPCVIAYAELHADLYRDRAEDLLMDMLPVDPHGASWTTSAATTEVKAFLEGSGASVATAQLEILPLRPTETFTNELFLVIDKCGDRHLAAAVCQRLIGIGNGQPVLDNRNLFAEQRAAFGTRTHTPRRLLCPVPMPAAQARPPRRSRSSVQVSW